MQKLKAEISKRTSDSKFFATTKRGELHELREELNSNDISKQKNAIKKVIANMTLGRDVSMLYPDVVKLSRTSNMELKKLVYLYIMNNSKLQPDKAILAVNTFVKDCQHENAVVRALALRTMLCIRVDNVTDYTTEPLRRGLADQDPYVRKTAAVGVLKLFAQKPQYVLDQGFIDQLKMLLMDASPMVVSNSIIALAEIQLLCSASPVLQGNPLLDVDLNTGLLNKLLNALPECTEWGQIVILDYIAQNYQVTHSKDVELLLDRIVPRLSHQNHAIVLSSIRILIKFLEYVSEDVKVNYYKKLSPPIVTLLGASQPPEIQYVVLRNVLVIIQKYPALLSKDVMTFFCKFNDPTYVKLEKLTILLKLLNDKNATPILSELKEYTSEVDVEFVRRVVKAIGFCALKVDTAAAEAIDILMECIKTKTDFVVNDCVIAIKDILRKYPGQFEGVIGIICEHLDTIDSTEAKTSLIWIIGEYAEKITNPMELLQLFIDSFHEEPSAVQIQILVATIKVFLKYPTANEATLQHVLRLCTEESDNPDLRDRAYFYWRLLSNDKMVNKLNDIILGPKPTMVNDEYALPRPLLEELLCCLNTLAATFHKAPAAFLSQKTLAPQDDDEEEDEEEEGEIIVIDSEGDPRSGSPLGTPSPVPAPVPVVPKTGDLDDIFDFTTQPTGPATASLLDDLTPTPRLELLLDPASSNGLAVSGCIMRHGAQILLVTELRNVSSTPMFGFVLQINKNCFGLVNSSSLQVPNPFLPGAVFKSELILSSAGERAPIPQLQIAIRNNQGTYYFTMAFPFHLAFTADGALAEPKEFIQRWRALPDGNERKFPLAVANPNSTAIEAILKGHNFFFVTKRSTEEQDNLYFSAKAFGEEVLLLEFVLLHKKNEMFCSCKMANLAFVEPLQQALASLL